MRYSLLTTDRGLILCDQYREKPALCVDYTGKGFLQRLKKITPKSELLVKAVNKKPGGKVLDMTAGLGLDAFVLAAYGHRVVMVERSRVVYLLVKDGLRRAAEQSALKSIVARLELVHGDSTVLSSLFGAGLPERFDVAMIDPMFDTRKKSALPVGAMQMLQGFLGSGADLQPFFDAARDAGVPRTVVKRPRLDRYQLSRGERPVYQLMGRSHRWDIFFNHS